MSVRFWKRAQSKLVFKSVKDEKDGSSRTVPSIEYITNREASVKEIYHLEPFQTRSLLV